MTMSNSPLVTYTKISPNSNNPRNKPIRKITIHHMAGNLSVEACGNIFAKASRQGSSNYGIGSDGRIGMYVEEKNRSWCSSNPTNDHQAITIEVANDGGAPNWHVSDKALASLINLCVDICKRNGIAKLIFTGDATGNLTQHNYFANTACPGPYLKSKFPYIADEVNKRLGGSNNSSYNFPSLPFTVKVLVDDLNYRSEPSMDGKVLGQTGKGIFTITKVSGGWGKLKSESGWIWLDNSKWVTIQAHVDENGVTFKPYTVRVEISDLNIRKGPSTECAVVGQTGKGIFTIVEESAGKGSTKGWGRLASGIGWISLDYVTKP